MERWPIKNKRMGSNQTGVDVRQIVQQAIEEFLRAQQQKVEPTYKTELLDERKRREALEGRLNQLVEENRRARAAAEGGGAASKNPRRTPEARCGKGRAGLSSNKRRHSPR